MKILKYFLNLKILSVQNSFFHKILGYGFKVFTDEMNYAQARGPHAEWPSISEAVYTATQSVIVDGTSAKDALETAAAKINPIVEETPLPESS